MLRTIVTATLFTASIAFGQDDGPIAGLLGGMGDHQYAVTTDDPLVQRFFDQGLVLTYGFNHLEAELSFREAARREPDCAMAWWGVALVQGPNINLGMQPDAVPKAWESIQRALALRESVSDKERGLIDALAQRYEPTASDDRSTLDQAYADAMSDLHARYPGDTDIGTLYAESLMDLHPWDYWEANGVPKPWANDILAVLDDVLTKDPDNPGANHLYVHAIEASKTPNKGVPSANRLRVSVPGAGHLLHMPSHIDIRVGTYKEGMIANEKSIEADDQYFSTTCGRPGVYTLAYYPHNWHFLWATATLAGDRAKAISAARGLVTKVDTAAMRAMKLAALEHFLTIPIHTLVKFEEWEGVLAEPQPPADLTYSQGIWRYARAIAFARTDEIGNARQELSALRTIAADTSLTEYRIWDINSTAEVLTIAREVATGEIAAADGETDWALKHLHDAVTLEDQLRYTEPSDWPASTRHTLGRVLLNAGHHKEAELTFKEDLAIYPENGWALQGLLEGYRTTGNAEGSADTQKRLAEAWAHADIEPGTIGL